MHNPESHWSISLLPTDIKEADDTACGGTEIKIFEEKVKINAALRVPHET